MDYVKSGYRLVVYRRARQPGGVRTSWVNIGYRTREPRRVSPPVLIFSRGPEAAGGNFIRYFFGIGRGGRRTAEAENQGGDVII